MSYRKLWESVYGSIPKDELGRSYEIHHKDGNRKNNKLENLVCLSIQEHYEIHLKQFIETGNHKDLAAARILAGKLNKNPKELKGYTLSEETKQKIKKKLTGVKHTKQRVDKMKKGLKGRKQSKEEIENRVKGIKQYYKEANLDDLKKRWSKISKAHKNKIVKDETKEKLSKINSKHSDENVLKIAKMIESGVKYKIISETFGISLAQITSIKQKKTYKWLWN